MSGINFVPINEDFENCYNEAKKHLQYHVVGGLKWYKLQPLQPFLEHMSFYFGNQLFFVKLEDVDHKLEETSTTKGLLLIAKRCKGHACIMPMRKCLGEWAPTEKGWGLLDAQTLLPVNPFELKSDIPIEMTDWELHDFAVTIIREEFEKAGIEVIEWFSNPDIDPSLWFVGETGPEWVVVRAARYPLKNAARPAHLQEVHKAFEHVGHVGYFASVLFTSLSETFDPQAEQNGNIAPLYRGEGLDVLFNGLELLDFE
jgi:hypothetical protein